MEHDGQLKLKASPKLFKEILKKIRLQSEKQVKEGGNHSVLLLATIPYADLFHRMLAESRKQCVPMWTDSLNKEEHMSLRHYNSELFGLEPGGKVSVGSYSFFPPNMDFFVMPDDSSETSYDFITGEVFSHTWDDDYEGTPEEIAEHANLRIEPCLGLWLHICKNIEIQHRINLERYGDGDVLIVATEPYAKVFNSMLSIDLFERQQVQHLPLKVRQEVSATLPENVLRFYPGELFPVECGTVIVSSMPAAPGLEHIFSINMVDGQMFDIIADEIRTPSVPNQRYGEITSHGLARLLLMVPDAPIFIEGWHMIEGSKMDITIVNKHSDNRTLLINQS